MQRTKVHLREIVVIKLGYWFYQEITVTTKLEVVVIKTIELMTTFFLKPTSQITIQVLQSKKHYYN